MIRFKNSKSFIYLLVYSLFSYLYILNYSLLDINLVYRVFCIFSVFVLFGLYISNFKKKKKFLLFSVIVACALLASWYKTGKYEIVLLVFFLICAPYTDFKKVVKCSATFSILGVFTVFLCSKLGIAEDIIYHTVNRNISNIHCYGFNYYTGPVYPLFFASLSIMWLLRNKKIRIKLPVFLAFNYILYLMFSVRLTLVCAIIVAIIDVIIVQRKKMNINKKAILCYATIAFPVFAIGTNILCYNYTSSNSLLLLINTVTNRLGYAQKALHEYGISLLGQKIQMYGVYTSRLLSKDYFYVDIGYVYTLVVYGLISFILIVGIYTWMYRKVVQINDKWTFMWITIILIFTAVNNAWITIAYNPIILFAPIMAQKWKSMINSSTVLQ